MSELIDGGNGQLIHILERQSCTKSWEKNAFYSTTREGTTETTWYYGDYISSHMISCHPQWSWWNQFSMFFEICHSAAIVHTKKNFQSCLLSHWSGYYGDYAIFRDIHTSLFQDQSEPWQRSLMKKRFIQVIPSCYSLEKCTKGIPNWTGKPVIEK